MAKNNVVDLHGTVKPKAKTGAERQAAYIARLKANGGAKAPPPLSPATKQEPLPRAASCTAAPLLTQTLFGYLLLTAALGLAGVGLTMNAWFARSLGSTEIAGWLFLVLGITSDLVALALPHQAAGLWQRRQHLISLMGWLVWLASFLFAVNAAIGFASTNVSDVTMARASRVTPAVTNAQNALADAMAARDRECRGGVGKFCREREAAVADRRQGLDAAQAAVAAEADPQTTAAMQIVTWVSGGVLHPKADDFAMLRLVLLALLPQIGGILMMVGRSK
jgi:hypothetical protein